MTSRTRKDVNVTQLKHSIILSAVIAVKLPARQTAQTSRLVIHLIFFFILFFLANCNMTDQSASFEKKRGGSYFRRSILWCCGVSKERCLTGKYVIFSSSTRHHRLDEHRSASDPNFTEHQSSQQISLQRQNIPQQEIHTASAEPLSRPSEK